MMQQVHFGREQHPGRLAGPDVREYSMMLALLGLTLAVGLNPQPLLEMTVSMVQPVAELFVAGPARAGGMN